MALAEVAELAKRETYLAGTMDAFEQSPRWIRVMINGQYVADSRRARLLYERGRTPVYYFPKEDVRTEYLVPSDKTWKSPSKGVATCWDVKVGDKTAENAAWAYEQPREQKAYLKDYISFVWDEMDAWFEEDEQVYVHPRDPYKRIDAIQSTRNVKVVIGGQTVAETDRPVLLFETGLPTRHYIPVTDVRMELLTDSDNVTYCPYKGEAGYYSALVGEGKFKDIAWYYSYPIPESQRIAGMVCFYNEHVDAIYVDGEELPRPRTPFS